MSTGDFVIVATAFINDLFDRGIQLRGKRVMEVGCQGGQFLFFMNRIGAECWGVDHTPAYFEEGISTGYITREDLPRLLAMSFSAVPTQASQELKGSFDVVRISGVIPFMKSDEMAQMFRSAHWLLKPGGLVHVELPTLRSMTDVYQPGQNYEDIEPKISAAYLMLRTRGRMQIMADGQAVKRVAKTNWTLANLHFSKVKDQLMLNDDLPILIAEAPREIIPDVKDIQINPATFELKMQGQGRELHRNIIRDFNPDPSVVMKLIDRNVQSQLGRL